MAFRLSRAGALKLRGLRAFDGGASGLEHGLQFHWSEAVRLCQRTTRTEQTNAISAETTSIASFRRSCSSPVSQRGRRRHPECCRPRSASRPADKRTSLPWWNAPPACQLVFERHQFLEQALPKSSRGLMAVYHRLCRHNHCRGLLNKQHTKFVRKCVKTFCCYRVATGPARRGKLCCIESRCDFLFCSVFNTSGAGWTSMPLASSASGQAGPMDSIS